MRLAEKKSQSHVISKIKKISVALDREEFWNYFILVGLFCLLGGALIYYVIK